MKAIQGEAAAAGEKGNTKTIESTESIETIVNDTIKELKKLKDFQYKDKIKQSIIDVIQYKLDNAKEDDLEAKKKWWEDTGYIERGKILIDAPSYETSHKPKSLAMGKNMATTMVAPDRARRRMWRSKDKSANLNDVILNSIKRAKTGKCFTFGKHFRITGTSNLDSQDAKIFTEFCIYATYNLYEQLTEELKTDIETADKNKSRKKTKRDENNNSIQEELILQVKTDLNDPITNKIDQIIEELKKINDKKLTNLITTLNTLKTRLKNKTILSPEFYNFLNIILDQIKFLTKQRENIISKQNEIGDGSTAIEEKIKEIQQGLLNKEKNSIENQILEKEKDFIINLDKIISKIENFNKISPNIKRGREIIELVKSYMQKNTTKTHVVLDKMNEAYEKKLLAEQILDTDTATVEEKQQAQNEYNLAAAAAVAAKNLLDKEENDGDMQFQAAMMGLEAVGDEVVGAAARVALEEATRAGVNKVKTDKKGPDTIEYEIDKFCNKYFQYFFEFARINIYVIVNCSSILNDLAKALALLIGLQLKKSIGTANQDKLVKDGVLKDESNKANESLTQDMKKANLFGSGAFFNMYSLSIIKYIGFIYENSIPEIERLIGSVNDKYTRLKILDNYLTSKYEKMVLGKEIHQKDNEKYEIDNPFIKNLLQDIFPNMGFSDGSIRKNIQNIDRAIEEHSDNIDLLQAELQNFLPIIFQENGLLFANKKIQEIMIQDGDKDELKRIIKEKEDEKDKLTRLLAQAQVKATARKDSAS